jgi:hypothetical protein
VSFSRTDRLSSFAPAFTRRFGRRQALDSDAEGQHLHFDLGDRLVKLAGLDDISLLLQFLDLTLVGIPDDRDRSFRRIVNDDSGLS